MLSADEIWRLVPPEEKLELLAQSQVSGVNTCFTMIGACAALAIALKLKWIFWVSLLASPLVFQTAAHRSWRGLKPKILLEYLAARSVARRFAFAGSAQNLSVDLLFRGDVTEIAQNESQELSDAIKAIESSASQTRTWIGLLNDSIVAFKENKGGGVLEFVSIADQRIKLDAKNSDGSTDEYSNFREIFITLAKPFGKESRYRLTSPYPAALNAFEKKLKAKIAARAKE